MPENRMFTGKMPQIRNKDVPLCMQWMRACQITGCYLRIYWEIRSYNLAVRIWMFWQFNFFLGSAFILRQNLSVFTAAYFLSFTFLHNCQDARLPQVGCLITFKSPLFYSVYSDTMVIQYEFFINSFRHSWIKQKKLPIYYKILKRKNIRLERIMITGLVQKN